ncbi:MAG: mannose-1-phosphate guanylyltransferase/mannose-6-phosphate isomerase [Desulfohalobiaceae bacterium]|nr:mannose-1-phosphate guanylyltransferase/mannose-6-phosphate isomerase [Desulfohalobiaceae bacterium]
MLAPVILCGGSGTRLWPMSRDLYPKQLLPLAGENSMLQDTLRRLEGLEDALEPILICNEEHRFLVAEQIRQMGWNAGAIVLEPEGRNTAPAAAIASLLAKERYGAEVELLLLPADHVILDPAAFREAVSRGREAARAGRLLTFGIQPTRPETGYGYIRTGDKFPGADSSVREVARFVEKPDPETAREYLTSGEYLWNSGMFLFTAERFLEDLGELAPQILDACREALGGSEIDFGFLRLQSGSFLSCPSDSVDCAVMERTAHAAVVPMQAEWSDVGSWDALWEVGESDDAGNVSQGDVLLSESSGSYVRAGHRLVAGIGIRDLVVVETSDAVLVADRGKSQQVKSLVSSLRQAGRSESRVHPTVHRPWGSYETIARGNRFQVKRLTVKPGAVLSRQLHHHRAEHWVIVRGTARISNGDKEVLLSEDQSSYIPLGTEHRLENPGKIPLELIEVQTGSYLGEDDIVRLEDSYGR